MRATSVIIAMLIGCSLIGVGVGAGSLVEGADAAGAELEALFARADRDPAGVVPLIVAGSEVVIAATPERAAKLADRLTPYCRRVFLSPELVPGMEGLGVGLHVVAAKETASGIARRHRLGAGMIARLNRRPELVPGRPLKLIDAAAVPMALVVSRTRFRLLVWHGRTLVAAFPVSVGKSGQETPLGVTTIAVSVRDPEWRDPDTHKLFAPKDPGNVLGGFWMGFDPLPDASFRGIGIHGYTAEHPDAWLEKRSSHGCVRLAQEDIAAVFDLVLPGCKVAVRE